MSELGTPRPAEAPVVRIWRGVVRTADRDEYVDYIEDTGMAQYRTTPGNLDAWMLTRDLPDGLTEILTVSRWTSMDAVSVFAGEDHERAVFYPEDDRFLVERDERVRHYRQREASVDHVGHAPHVPGPDEPTVPELEDDETIAPRPEEEIADALRATPDVADHSGRAE